MVNRRETGGVAHTWGATGSHRSSRRAKLDSSREHRELWWKETSPNNSRKLPRDQQPRFTPIKVRVTPWKSAGKNKDLQLNQHRSKRFDPFGGLELLRTSKPFAKLGVDTHHAAPTLKKTPTTSKTTAGNNQPTKKRTS